MKFFCRYFLIFLCVKGLIFLPLKNFADDGRLNGELVVSEGVKGADDKDELPLSFRLALVSIILGVPVCAVAVFSMYHALGYSHCYDDDIGV